MVEETDTKLREKMRYVMESQVRSPKHKRRHKALVKLELTKSSQRGGELDTTPSPGRKFTSLNRMGEVAMSLTNLRVSLGSE